MIQKNNEYNAVAKRASDLYSQRKKVLALPPEKALDSILKAKHPAALVHSFREDDFYFLVNDIGINDSFELLALASDRQWDYILDVGLWEKDRIDTGAITKWLDILFQAAPERFVKWIVGKKTDLMEYYLFNNIRVAVREHDQDPSTLGEGLVTFDDVYYIKALEKTDYEAPEHESEREKETNGKSDRGEFIIKLLEKIAEYDYGKYQQILFESTSVLPAEMEEEFYRLRNVRLSEKGFLPFHEAAGIYSPLNPEELLNRKKISKRKQEYVSLMPIPLYPFGMLKEKNLFTMSLKRISHSEVLQVLQVEFAALCNQIISADHKNIKNREELKEVVRKACGYLSIGLERLLKTGQKADTDYTSAMIQKYHIAHIFRTGFGLTLELKERAQKWIPGAWFKKAGFSLSFWGEEWTGILGGLLIKKPLYFDNYKTGRIYREFATLSDVEKTRRALEDIIILDDLMRLINVDTSQVQNRFLNHKKVILTLFARYRLGLPKELLPVPYDDFVRFFSALWTGRGKSRKINISVKESFLNWLIDMTGFNPSQIKEKLGRVLDDLFCEIENEYKKVAQRDLDPRYIALFLVEKRHSGIL